MQLECIRSQGCTSHDLHLHMSTGWKMYHLQETSELDLVKSDIVKGYQYSPNDQKFNFFFTSFVLVNTKMTLVWVWSAVNL